MWLQLSRMPAGSAPVAAATRADQRADLRLDDPDDVHAAEHDASPVAFERDRTDLEREPVAVRVPGLSDEADHRQPEGWIERERCGAGTEVGHLRPPWPSGE